MAFMMQEFLCDACGRFESLVDRPAPTSTACPDCGALSERCISAVKSRTVYGSVVRGKSDPPPHPLASNPTGVVGESRSMAEWKAERQSKWRDFDRKRRRAMGAPV